jgi:hypothetical protein
MVFTWTEQSALNLTEDEQVRRDGTKLATRAKWPALGVDEQAIWGQCQGSGKEPYRVCVDKSELAYRCSCPSKKFPCKHTMALLLLFAKDQVLFQQSAAPGWVTEWLEGRQKRTAKERDGKETVAVATPIDSQAQSKRAQARATKVDEGLKELRLWLSDLVRHGFVNPQVKSYAYWDRMAARMVDAQASAIARRLRQIASIPLQGQPDWASRLLDEVSRIYLLAESYQRIDTLPPELQEDLRTAIGWAHKKEELLALPAGHNPGHNHGGRDHWRVVGQVVEGDDTLRTRRVWLFGERTGQAALLLDFAVGRASFDEMYMTGQRYDAELAYYPSAFPQRALVKQIFSITTPDPAGDQNSHQLLGYASATAMLAAYATALGGNPWLERVPFILHKAIVAQRASGWALYDAESRLLPVKLSGKGVAHLWGLLAQSGGHPTTVMGEWDGYEVNLLGLI